MENQNKMKDGVKFGIFIVAILFVAIGINYLYPPEANEIIGMPNMTFITWGYEDKYTLNITAPEGSTHYDVQVGSSYIYLGENYYDLKPIPENRIIEIHRTGPHQTKICYWVLQENGLYQLIEMGVYQ